MDVGSVVTLIVGLAGSVATILAVLISSKASRDNMTQELRTQNAIQNEKIANLDKNMADLREEVRVHNNFARRMPVVEEQVKSLFKKTDDLADQLARKQ